MLTAVFEDASHHWTAATFAAAVCAGIVLGLLGIVMTLNFGGMADRWQASNERLAARRGGGTRARQAAVASKAYKATGWIFIGGSSITGLALVQSESLPIRGAGIAILVIGGLVSLLAFMTSLAIIIRAGKRPG